MYPIKELTPAEFPLCAAIWDMQAQKALADRFYAQLLAQNRVTFVCSMDGAFVGEVSLVRETDDRDYTIPGRRAYLSRLMVKREYRRRGIGAALSAHLFHYAKAQGYTELALGVDLDNYPALKLYSGLDFTRILRVDEDEQGRYLKLLKQL